MLFTNYEIIMLSPAVNLIDVVGRQQVLQQNRFFRLKKDAESIELLWMNLLQIYQLFALIIAAINYLSAFSCELMLFLSQFSWLSVKNRSTPFFRKFGCEVSVLLENGILILYLVDNGGACLPRQFLQNKNMDYYQFSTTRWISNLEFPYYFIVFPIL